MATCSRILHESKLCKGGFIKINIDEICIINPIYENGIQNTVHFCIHVGSIFLPNKFPSHCNHYFGGLSISISISYYISWMDPIQIYHTILPFFDSNRLFIHKFSFVCNEIYCCISNLRTNSKFFWMANTSRRLAASASEGKIL